MEKAPREHARENSREKERPVDLEFAYQRRISLSYHPGSEMWPLWSSGRGSSLLRDWSTGQAPSGPWGREAVSAVMLLQKTASVGLWRGAAERG